MLISNPMKTDLIAKGHVKTDKVDAGAREAKALARAWKDDYNLRRPHSALGYRTPAEHAAATAWAASGLGSLAPSHPTPLADETLIALGA